MKLSKKQREIREKMDVTNILKLSEALPIAKKYSSKKVI